MFHPGPSSDFGDLFRRDQLHDRDDLLRQCQAERGSEAALPASCSSNTGAIFGAMPVHTTVPLPYSQAGAADCASPCCHAGKGNENPIQDVQHDFS